MSVNWMRHFELLLESDEKEPLRFSDLKVTFTVDANIEKAGSEATIVVYNLSPETRNNIMNGEYQKLKIQAGYDGLIPTVDISEVGKAYVIPKGMEGQIRGMNFGEIFSGEIRYAFLGEPQKSNSKSSPSLDRALTIRATSGYKAGLEADLNTTVAAGYNVDALLALNMRTFNPFGITRGATGKMPETRFPRGRVLYQKATQLMDNIAAQCRASWQFVDGKLQLVPEDNYLENIVVLNSETGLLGTPELTTNGVTINCLINPNIHLHSLIQIDLSTLRRLRDSSEAYRKGSLTTENNKDKAASQTKGNNSAKEQTIGDISADGVYIVKAIKCEGDTRGANWGMELTCTIRDKETALT